MKIEHKSMVQLLDIEATDASFTIKREGDQYTMTIRGDPGSILPSLVIRKLNTMQLKALAQDIVRNL